MLRLERHPFGPRVYLLHRRIHEYHLGLAILVALAAGSFLDDVDLGLTTILAALAGVWLVAKDWRDLVPSKRDSAMWQLGLHRRAAPLRGLRRYDSLPLLAALWALAAGIVNLVSAATPNSGWRHRVLLRVESLDEIRIFHALALPASAGLIVTAFYLYRRRRGALHVAVGLLLALGVLNLAKGLDFEEAVWSFAAAGLLWWGRAAFHVRHDPAGLRSAFYRVPAVVAATTILIVGSVWIAAPSGARAGAILRTAGDALLWQPGPIAFHDEMGRLPLAVGLLALAALLACAYLIFRPLAAPRSLPDAEARQAARQLVRRHGMDTLAFFKLRRDKQYLFDRDRSAFLAYRIENGVLLCSGDPVGPPAALPGLVSEAVAYAERRGLKLAASGVSEELVPLWRQAGLRSLYIGDEAVVETGRFSLEGRAIRKVRQSVARLEKGGYWEISLIFAAFARVMHGPRGPLERLVGRLVALGNPYFQIESLYRFNAKFFPRWEPRYLLYEGALGLPRAGLAVMWAEGQLPKPRRRVTVEAKA